MEDLDINKVEKDPEISKEEEDQIDEIIAKIEKVHIDKD